MAQALLHLPTHILPAFFRIWLYRQHAFFSIWLYRQQEENLRAPSSYCTIIRFLFTFCWPKADELFSAPQKYDASLDAGACSFSGANS